MAVFPSEESPETMLGRYTFTMSFCNVTERQGPVKSKLLAFDPKNRVSWGFKTSDIDGFPHLSDFLAC